MRAWRWGVLASIPLLALGSTAAQGSTVLDRLRKQAIEQAERGATAFLEIANIKNRLFQFGKPGRIAYVTFLADNGRPILYLPVTGKCTSSGKRLVPGEHTVLLEEGSSDKETYYRGAAIAEQSDDGTYGSSAPYIYCFTPNGTYFQWNGKHLESARPIELNIRPVVMTGRLPEKSN